MQTKNALLILCLLLITITVSAIGEDSRIGQIAVIGSDYNVYIVDAETEASTAITDDATENRRYQWVTWSPDGRLAFFCCDLRVARRLNSEAFIYHPDIETIDNLYNGQNESIIYASWSPQGCDDLTCRDLALLVNDVRSGELALKLARHGTESIIPLRTLATGGPLYYQWDYSGQQMLIHRNNEQVEIINLDDDRVTSIGQTNRINAAYQSAIWSPLDNTTLFAQLNDNRMTELVQRNAAGDITVIADDLSGFISFLWSPDGRYIAYRTADRNAIGQVIIIDAITGEIIRESFVGQVISFFWSPDSQKLAYITPSGTAAPVAQTSDEMAKPLSQSNIGGSFAWSVLDVESGIDLLLTSFVPTYEMQYMMTYFDQFSSGHTVWSPDSQYLVYSTLRDSFDDTSTSVIEIIRTESTAIPQVIADGVLGVWSFE